MRRIRDDFAARTAGLEPAALIALIRREAAAVRPESSHPETRRPAA